MRRFRIAAMIVAFAASCAGSVGARPVAVPRSRAFAAILLAPSAGDVSYGLAQVRIGGRPRVLAVPASPGQVAYAGRVGGLAVTVRSSAWSALRASTRVYVVVSRVAGQDGSVRDVALFVVRRRTIGGARRRLQRPGAFVFSVANATAAVGSFWVRGLDRSGFARIFAVRDMLGTAVANWGRYVRVLRAADAVAAAMRPLELSPPARERRLAARSGAASMWTGGLRPTRREQVIFHLIVDALGNPLEYAAVKRNPLIAEFIARELNNPRLALRWRRVTTALPLQVPDRYAAAAQEEAQFNHVVAPRVSRNVVAISDSTNSSSQMGHDDPLPSTTLTVDVQGYGDGLVTGTEEVYGPNLSDCTASPSKAQCTATFRNGATYETLSAAPRPVPTGFRFAGDQSVFAGWTGCDQIVSGNCKVLVGDANRTVTATFTLANSIQVILIGSATNPVSNGLYVSSDPAGISCPDGPDGCIAAFNPGQQVTLTEHHGSTFDSRGIDFHGWGGCDQVQPGLGATDTCNVTVTAGSKQVVADFELANPAQSRPDEPPAAAFTITPDPALPTSDVTFDGSPSSDPDGQITDYRWSFSNMSDFDSFGGSHLTRSFGCYGSVRVTLRVTDSDGQTASTSHYMTISPEAGFGHCEVAGEPSIITIAGDGSACHGPPACGDGEAATSAQLNFPAGLAVDTHGNVYVADTSDQEVRQITPEGAIIRLAGDGTICFTAGCGDGGPAFTAQLHNPQAVAVDSAGNVYIADTDDETVRKVAPDGTITRVAGIHGDPCTTAPACGDGGPARSARLDQPLGVAVDTGGSLYIADAGDNEVRKVTPDGTITRFAGTGMQCTSAPDCGDGLSATLATLNTPEGIAVDSAGTVYIADTGDNEVRVVALNAKIVRFAGTGRQCTAPSICGDGGRPGDAELNNPGGVAVGNGGLVYIADTGDNEVRVAGRDFIRLIAGDGARCTTAPACGDGGQATRAQLRFPSGVAVDTLGEVDIADTQDHEVRQVAP